MAKDTKKKNPPKSETSILVEHPEIKNNARGYFRHENGKVIVEDRVPRGDADRRYDGFVTCQGDVAEPDLRTLANYAHGIIDEKIDGYDKKVAIEDALTRAINEMESGKYAGKINAVTFKFIVDNFEELSKVAKKIKKKAAEYLGNMPETKESTEDKAMLDKEGMQKLAELLATDKDAREEFKGMLSAANKKQKDVGPAEEKVPAEVPAEEPEACAKSASVLEQMDKLAGELEASGDFRLFKVAFQLDRISDVLEGKKEAATLEKDPDESYMKQFFQAGARQTDSDEKYMKSFDTDKTTQVEGIVKHASEKRPYRIVSAD